MKTSRKIAAAALAGTLASAGAAAAADSRSTPADQTSVSITIYNDNLGLVKDVRAITLATGIQNLWFEGVAAQIDPTTVHIVSLDAANALTVLEQNFEYDLISPSRLMEKYLGQTVEVIMEHEDGTRETVRAKLIGNQEGAVYELEDGRIAVNPGGRVVLPSLPAGLISRPSLVWLLDSKRAKQTVEASYLTGGIGWKADYVVVLSADDKKVDLSGWVTIDNRSGTTYENAALKLVAGDVNRVRPELKADMMGVRVMGRAEAVPEQFAEESFFEYHLYTLERKATIKDNQTKQIALLSAEKANVKKSFVVEPLGSYWFARYDGVEKPEGGCSPRARELKEERDGYAASQGHRAGLQEGLQGRPAVHRRGPHRSHARERDRSCQDGGCLRRGGGAKADELRSPGQRPPVPVVVQGRPAQPQG